MQNLEIESPFWWDEDEVVYGGFIWHIIDLSDNGEIKLWPAPGWKALGSSFNRVPRPSLEEEVRAFVRKTLR